MIQGRLLAVTMIVAAILPGRYDAGAQSQVFKGWPGHDDISDLKGCFANPPKGYGNVPFYWWTGDPLDIERLDAQLDILADASTDGLCVSYNHTDAKVDIELNADGHGPCGRVSGGEPRVMSDQWWKIWNEFSAHCAEKGIGLGMDDYVIAWPKNKEFIDDILNSESFTAYQGKLVEVRVANRDKKPRTALTIASRDRDSTTYICTASAPWLHPDFGKEVIAKYFQPFVDHMDAEGLKGMNYFFQDELQYGLDLRSWSEDMPVQFRKRKGYDIVPQLPKLFIDDPEMIDAEAAKVRLDYAEVLTQLSEERYFKPIFDWNADKGLIYGCDNEGRGLWPTHYLDYFRAVSWFTAPGNDAPARGSSFRQTKVSSSIAHLYGRPRTWLEAFHSMGWDANGALLKTQLDHHIIAGGNLLCMHGLYYSTHGGWWEWAPPCFHFRMPYWPHMKLWLKYAERMCFLLSQGRHVCDIALMYPTETMQAVPGTGAGSTFSVSDALSEHGMDYDFIDYQSLQKAGVRDASLSVAGESYKVLVLVDTRAMHSESLEKVREFRAAGGIVLAVGDVMPEILALDPVVIEKPGDVPAGIKGLINTDFRTGEGTGRVLHRRIGDRDVYMVMNVEQGDRMYFRSRGMAEKWDAMDGGTTPLKVLETDAEGSWIRYEGESGNSMLVVFSPGEPLTGEDAGRGVKFAEQRITGDWDITVIPTMDNKWGDFRLPASDGFIGVEARDMRYFTDINAVNWNDIPQDVYGYGPYMLACNVDSGADLDAFLASGLDAARWSPYVWSWQYGVPDSPGSQGYHGLKSRVDHRFLILDQGMHQIFRTKLIVPEKGKYRMIVEGEAPYRILLDGAEAEAGVMKLKEGAHDLVIAYKDTKKTDYRLDRLRGDTIDRRDRSMVIFYPASAAEPQDSGLYGEIVASRWYGTPHLTYDVTAEPQEWHYQFETAPGTTEMKFKVRGSISEVLIDGAPVQLTGKDGEYRLELADVNPGISTVTLTGTPLQGYPGPAFFEGPVKIECSGGRMPEGDWTRQGALKFYSGAVRYSKDVMTGDPGTVVELDLGEVDATCEVSVNGSSPKVLIGSPYRTDITEYVHPGLNHIEVLVYSTLSNHYGTIPSPYRGTPHAGLIGPVRLLSAE